MRRRAATLLPALAVAPAFAAPGVERWTALNRTAMAITGDIALSPARLVAAGKSLTLAVATDVSSFGTLTGPVPARILKVTTPADPVLLRGNRLCGTAVRWIVAHRSDDGRRLTLAAFTGDALPTSESGSTLCATFSYAR